MKTGDGACYRDLSGHYEISQGRAVWSGFTEAAVSIPSNIAEGSDRKNTKEFIQFLYIAKGSLLELETQLEIARRLGYITNIEHFTECIIRLRIMLVKLISSLESK
ncbi:MAG TPA: four helix bundle protein [Candidatus Syntrophosphaera sp.]|nr:four helix bundle protein [Candidatus Syntrophosphaera sp.]